MKRFLVACAIALSTALPTQAQIFDNTAGTNGVTNRDGSLGIGQGFVVTTTQVISDFGFLTNGFSAAIYEFFIADAANHVVFNTFQTFSAGSGLMMSGPMLFTLVAGNSYSFGLLKDGTPGTAGMLFHLPNVLIGQNGLTPQAGNQNWMNFGAPTRGGDGSVTFAMRIDGGATTVTPEPTSIALIATGLAGLASFARRRRKPV